MFSRWIRIAAHPVKRQRRKLVRTGRVNVHLFAEAVGVEQERARPTSRQRRKRFRVKRKTNLISGPADYKHVIALQQQFAHVTFARVAPSHYFPGRSE